MLAHLRHFPLVVLLGGVAIGAARPGVPAGTPKDLDALTPAQLNADLEAELDDIYEGHAPDVPVAISILEGEILQALDDEGDDGLEVEIDRDDLDAEMAEANTTLENVISQALAAIDDASGPVPHAPRTFFAAFGNTGPEQLRTTRRLAVRETKKQIVTAIQAVRR